MAWGTKKLLVFVGMLICMMSGCGSYGSASGTVTYKGKKVTSGGVTLIASDNLPYSSLISSDGTFKIEKVPTGSVKIGVNSPNPSSDFRQKARSASAASEALKSSPSATSNVPAKSWFPLPDKYSDPLNSGLTDTIKGDSTIMIDLK
ncbi:MAG: hypothetical protein ACKO26_20045 [Planctomycetota bacterium]